MGCWHAQLGGSPVTAQDLARWIPLPLDRTDVRPGAHHTLISLSWNTPLDRELVMVGDQVVAMEGLPRFADPERAVVRVGQAGIAPPPGSYAGNFCAVAISDSSLVAWAGTSGEYPVFWWTDGTQVVATTRPALIIGPRDLNQIDELAAAWMCGRGWFSDSRRLQAGLNQLMPGELLIAERSPAGAIACRVVQPDLAGVFITDEDAEAPSSIRARIDDVIDGWATTIGELEVPADLWTVHLSGGRDSRCVAALVEASGRLGEVGEFVTNGPPWSEDVLAARQLAAAWEITDRHDVRAPTASDRDSVSTLLATMLSTQGTLSAFDTKDCVLSSRVTFAGHETLRLDPTRRIDITSSSGAQFHAEANGGLLLTQDATAAVGLDRLAQYRALVAQGVPEARLYQAMRWMHRTGGWISNIMSANHYGNHHIDPLLDDQFMALAFTLPEVCLAGEVIQYLAIQRSQFPIVDSPYADLAWKPELRNALDRLGADDLMPNLAIPTFGGVKAMQGASRPALGSRQGLLTDYAALSLTLLDRHGADMPYVAVDSAREQLRMIQSNANQLGVVAQIGGLGLLTVLLAKEYGAGLYEDSRQAEIGAELRSMIAAEARTSTVEPAPAPAATVDDALAAVLVENRQLRERVVSLKAKNKRLRASAKNAGQQGGPVGRWLRKLLAAGQRSTESSSG